MRKNVFVICRFLLMALAWISTSIFFLWAVGAIWHLDFLPRLLAKILALAALSAGIYGFVKCNPRNRWLTYAGATIGVAWGLSLFQTPSHDRAWAFDQTVLSTVDINGDDVTISNFRNSDYRSETEFDVRRSDYQFRLNDLSRMWFVVQRFSASEGMAHVFLTFEVDGDANKEFFAVSVEIRRETDEYFSPIQGLYRQYELNYIFGSEQDLIGVRTVMRPDDRVFMYPINANPQQVQQLFLSIAERCNRIEKQPEFYHTLLNNCMNGILRHTKELTDDEISWFDPQIVFPGYSDRYAWKRGFIGSDGQSFEELKLASRIDQRARKHGLQEGFSTAIRTSANSQ